MTAIRARILLGAFGVGIVIGCLLAPPAAHADSTAPTVSPSSVA